MNRIDNSRKVEITIRKVEGIPCSIVGNRMVFSIGGTLESEPGRLPWRMPWIEGACRELAMEMAAVTQKRETRLYNREEQDQFIEVSARSYIDLTVGQLADQTCSLYPKHEVLVNSSGSRRFDFGQLKEITTDLAKGLIAAGTEKDGKVAVWAVNSPEFVMAQIGISKAGGIMIPLNAHESELLMETLLRQSDTATLIMQVGAKSTENIELLYRLCPELSDAAPGKLKSERFPSLKNVVVISDEEYPGTFKWSELMSLGRTLEDDVLLRRQSQLSHEDVAYIIFTSGTTGAPKGVMLSHSNVIENALEMADRMQITEKDVICVQSPLFHCFGCVVGVLPAIIRGCSMAIVDRFRSEITLALIEREKCTVVSGVPTMFIAFIKELRENCFDLSSVRTGIIAGASCPPKLIHEIQEVLGIKNIIPAYGLTEASPCITAAYGDDPEEIKASSTGAPIPGVEVKIVSPETKEALKTGDRGEILARGYNIMSGYYRMPEESAIAIDDDGWLHTGDFGYFTPEGRLVIQGRFKDIIIRSGENISPKEIEDVLDAHPDVEDVNVVGVPSYIYGEEVVAFIRKKDGSALTEEILRQYCRGKLSTNKTPKTFFFLDKFPVSDSGKCKKSELRRMAVELMAQSKSN